MHAWPTYRVNSGSTPQARTQPTHRNTVMLTNPIILTNTVILTKVRIQSRAKQRKLRWIATFVRYPDQYPSVCASISSSQYRPPDSSIATGRVITQASAMFMTVLRCNPAPLATLAPATPDDRICVVDTGNP